jgi:Arc/MetJ-type ribon-helix-helix transcriptional regulator
MAETEKITINLSVVDLGKVDLLVEQGFYSNRSDFVRTAIRNQLSTHAEIIEQTVVRKHMNVGVSVFTRSGLEKYRANGEKLDIKVVGMVGISKNVTPELALDTIQSLEVHGVLRASKEVKDALAGHIK